jgi:hypothetical protein
MARRSELARETCPVCEEAGQVVYRYGEAVIATADEGAFIVVSQAICAECLRVILEATEGGWLNP